MHTFVGSCCHTRVVGSGKSNVLFWLERRGIPATDDVVDRIYQRAKSSDHTLSEAEILESLPAATAKKS